MADAHQQLPYHMHTYMEYITARNFVFLSLGDDVAYLLLVFEVFTIYPRLV